MEHHDWDERYASKERLWSAQPNAGFVEVASGLAPARALELGSGEGADAVWLAERGWTVTAVDFSSVALERARTIATARRVEVTWIQADLREYVPSPRSFDLVAALYLHLPPSERRTVLARAAEAVARGGTIIVLGHDRSNPPEAQGPRHRDVLFSPEEIAADLHGLVIERAESIERPAQVDGREVLAVDAIVVAHRWS